jgi:hypothetical protein
LNGEGIQFGFEKRMLGKMRFLTNQMEVLIHKIQRASSSSRLSWFD